MKTTAETSTIFAVIFLKPKSKITMSQMDVQEYQEWLENKTNSTLIPNDELKAIYQAIFLGKENKDWSKITEAFKMLHVHYPYEHRLIND